MGWGAEKAAKELKITLSQLHGPQTGTLDKRELQATAGSTGISWDLRQQNLQVYKEMVKPAVLPGVTGMLRCMGQWTACEVASKAHAGTRTES